MPHPSLIRAHVSGLWSRDVRLLRRPNVALWKDCLTSTCERMGIENEQKTSPSFAGHLDRQT